MQFLEHFCEYRYVVVGLYYLFSSKYKIGFYTTLWHGEWWCANNDGDIQTFVWQ